MQRDEYERFLWRRLARLRALRVTYAERLNAVGVRLLDRAIAVTEVDLAEVLTNG